MLKELEDKIKVINEEVEVIKKEIKYATKTLQDRLKEKEKELKEHKTEVKKLNKDFMNNESIHILDRFKAWIESPDKTESTWIIESGPMRDTLFDDEYRYSTVNLEDRIQDMMYEIGYYICELDDDVEIDLLNIKDSKLVFDAWPEKAKQKFTSIIEDCIKQNVSSYTQDW
mgnify:CR=1 FL=1